MDVKGANPFLFGEDDYTSPSVANSNPFLMNEDDFNNTGNDNPFLSQSATTVSSNSNSTNPFAFDPMDLGPQEAEPAEIGNNVFMSSNQFVEPPLESTNIFSINNTLPNDFLSNAPVAIPNVIPEKPTELNLKYTNTVADDSKQYSIIGGPPRPPPPRPPPSKETQDLLMSVMGAMDATSSHLLDRIPPTRTPSPVSMRDLHSPSPTPEPFADFLDVSDTKPASVPSKPSSHTDDLMSLTQDTCDINQNPPLIAQTKMSPPKPTPPVRPPRPIPPQKPPPPKFVPQNTSPPKPPPASVVPKTDIPQQSQIMDLFGVEEKPNQKATASTADILSLYNTAVVSQPPVTDLLSDSVETTMTTETVTNTSIINEGSHATPLIFDTTDTNVDFSLSNPSSDVPDSFVATPVIQDNFISPEPSQADLQMDTSDSQSKGSVSSVTFNPFAAADDNAVTSPKQIDEFQQENPSILDNSAFQQQSDIFGQNTETVVQNDTFQPPQTNNVFTSNISTAISSHITPPTDAFDNLDNKVTGSDDFDAFAMKFESAAKDENKNGFMNAFASSGDAWGNQPSVFNDPISGFNETSGGGFGVDESFDAFLAMREPPAVPQSTPSRLNKAGSLDSDDGKDFSVVIRPKANDDFGTSILPVLAPPPAPVQNAFNDNSPRFNPFDQQTEHVVNIPNLETATPFGMRIYSFIT